MSKKTVKKMCLLVREGQISFEQFVANTRKDFFALATHLLRRWNGPAWFTVDDVEQELYLGAWKYISRWDPDRGKSIEEYVTWNAMCAAKRHLHSARGVSLSGSPDRKLSNFEAPLSSIGEEGEGEMILQHAFVEPVAENVMIDHETRYAMANEVLKTCETRAEKLVVLAIRDARSIDNAGDMLYDNFDQRIELRLGSEEIADRFVMRTAKTVAKRMARDCVNPV